MVFKVLGRERRGPNLPLLALPNEISRNKVILTIHFACFNGQQYIFNQETKTNSFSLTLGSDGNKQEPLVA